MMNRRVRVRGDDPTVNFLKGNSMQAKVTMITVMMAGLLTAGSTLAQDASAAPATEATPAQDGATAATTEASVTLEPIVLSDGTKLETLDQMVSYMAGLRAGQSIKTMPMDIKPDSALALRGFEESVAGQPTATVEQLQSLVEQVNKILSAKIQVLQQEFMDSSKVFLEENAKKEGVKTTLSGLQYKIIDPGAGPSPKDGDTVTVNYTGKLVNGRVFDSSIERGQPASFPVNGVIPGFSEALKMMKPGAKWELVIPPILAYGEQGAGNAIPGGAVLIFEVELIKIGE